METEEETEGYCDTCAYAEPVEHPEGMRGHIMLCRRFPPVPVSVGGRVKTVQPFVNINVDWCGEHEPAEDDQAELHAEMDRMDDSPAGRRAKEPRSTRSEEILATAEGREVV